jgi:DNA excision repair protein ERCC-3
MSVGLETNDIVEVLNRLSKIPLPRSLVARIEDWTSSYGKIKLVLKHNRYSLETSVPEFLQILLKDEVVGPCRVIRDEEDAGGNLAIEQGVRPRRDYLIPGTEEARRAERGELEGGPGGQAGRGRERDDVIGAVIGINESECYQSSCDMS